MSLPRALLLAAATALTLRAAPALTDLGTLGGSYSSTPVNFQQFSSAASFDGSVVVGDASTVGNSTTHAFLYMGGVMTDLGTLGGTYSSARGVSSDGTVVFGTSDLAGNAGSHAFRYTAGVMTDLGTLGGTYSSVFSLSANGSVLVGESGGAGNTATHAFIYAGGVMTDIGTFGGNYSSARLVSADGSIVVGSYQSGNSRAFLYTGGVMTDIGTLGGSYTEANGLSADGSVLVGLSNLVGNSEQHGIIYTGGVMTDIGTLGGTYSSLNGVSANGMVSYGYASLSGDAATHSILYAGGVMTDVDLLLSASFGSQSSNIFGISADGSVAVGYYMLSGMYNYRGFYYANGVVSDMGDLGGPNYNYAAGVSGDGSTLYGNASLQAGGMHAVTLALSYVPPTTITTSIDASDARVTGGGVLQFQGGTLAPVGTGALTLANDITVLASSTGTLDATNQDIASTGAVTINGTSLTLAGSATSVISLAGLVSGAGGLINDGGVNTLAQSSTYTGATVVNAGKLIQVDTSQSAAIQIAAGATFEFKATSAIAHSGDTVFTGVGTLLKTGAGELGWYETSATFNFSRGALIHVAEGSLIGGSTANEDWSNNHSDLQVDAGAGFQGIEADVRVNRLMGGGVISSGYSSPYHGFTVGVDGGDGLFTGTIVDTAQGSGQIAVIIKTGAGELALSGVNTYSGGTILQAGALRAGNNAAFGSGTITLNAGVLSSDGSTARTLANALDIAGDATLGDAVKTGALTLAGPVSVGSGKIIAVASDVTVSGAVTSAGGFTKAGLGVLTLSASGTIAASSLVVAGGTLVNSGAITADVSVATGATLRGSGAITGTITLAGVGAAGQAGALIIEAPNGGSSYGSQSIILSADATIAVNGSGQHYHWGVIDGVAAGQTLTLDTGSSMFLPDGGIGANIAHVIKEGSGMLYLRAVVAGDVTISAGSYHAGAAGATGTGVTVNAGASLRLNSDGGTPINFVAPLTLSGAGALQINPVAPITQSGAITLTADSSIESGSQENVISGAIGGATPGQHLTLLVSDHTLKLTGTTAASIVQVTKTGAGVLLVDSSAVIAAGSVVITDGLLTNNGSITGTISVTGTGVLGGSGTINGAVTINGILAPGNSPGIQIQASGDTTLATGSRYQAQLGGTTAGNGDGFHDQYYVQAGRLNLDPGVTLDVLPWVKADGSTTFVPARRDAFTILRTSGGIAGVFADITNDSGSQWVLYDNAPTLHALGKLYGTGLNGDQTFAAYASSPAHVAIATSLWNAAVTASASSTTAHPAGFIDGDTAYGQMAIALLTAPDADAFLGGLSPDAYLAVGDYALTVSRSLTDAAFAQASLLHSGSWTVGAGYNRAQHGYAGANSPAYELSSDTPLVTVAYDFGKHCSVGFFYGQNRGKTTADNSRIDYRGGVFGLTSVGRLEGAYPLTLQGALVASDLQFSATRGGCASGARKLRSFGGQLTASAEVYKDGRLTVSPTLGFVQGRATTSVFTEAGTGANLTIDAMAQDSSRVVAGFGLTYRASTNLVFDLSAAYEHEFAADAGGVSATFGGVGAPMTTTRAIDDRDSTSFGLGASWKLDHSMTVRLGAEVRGNRELRNDHRYNASVNVRF